jgi:O-antigen/teichoic acid export membrane protein
VSNPSPQPTPLARAGRNIMLKTLGEAGARLCFAILFILAARLLGKDDWGLFTYAASLAALAVVGVDLGLNTLTIRDGSRHPEKLPFYAGTILIIKLIMALVVLCLIYVFCLFKEFDSSITGLIMFVALTYCIGAIQFFGAAGLNAMECMDKDALVRVLSRMAALLLCGTGILYGLGLTGMVGGLLVANTFGVFLAMRFLAQRTSFKVRFKDGFFGYLLKESLPLALNNIFILVYFRVDIVMLEAFGETLAAIGWYGAGVRLIDAVGMVPGMVAMGLMPVLSSLAIKDPKAMHRLYIQGQSLLLILGIPAAVGLFVLREPIVALIYGPQFAPTTKAFIWLAPVLALLFLNYLQLRMLTILGEQKLCALSTGVCVLVNVGLNLILIPRYGFEGAAAATLLTEVILLLLCAWFLERLIGGTTKIIGLALRPSGSTLVMWLSFWVLDAFTPSMPVGLWLPLAIAWGGLVYFGTLFAVKGLTPAQGRELYSIIRGRSTPRNAGV